MIWSQRHGETAFTVPMFDGFMKRQMPILEKHTPKRRLLSDNYFSPLTTDKIPHFRAWH